MTQVFAQTVLIVSRHTRCFPTGHLTVAMCSTVNTSERVCLQFRTRTCGLYGGGWSASIVCLSCQIQISSNLNKGSC